MWHGHGPLETPLKVGSLLPPLSRSFPVASHSYPAPPTLSSLSLPPLRSLSLSTPLSNAYRMCLFRLTSNTRIVQKAYDFFLSK